jgi:hypothetical protein
LRRRGETLRADVEVGQRNVERIDRGDDFSSARANSAGAAASRAGGVGRGAASTGECNARGRGPAVPDALSSLNGMASMT